VNRNTTVRSSVLQVITAISILVAFSQTSAQAQESSADEYEVRAAMIFNLSRFVEWPNGKYSAAASPFDVCLLGADASAAALDRASRGKTIDGKAIALRRLGRDDVVEGCRILYVANSERKRFGELVPALAKAAVLTVGDQEWFVSAGGIVGLPLVESRVRIEINLASALRSNLSVSSKLLRLATVAR
jgi:hypothetical protein